MMPPLILDGRGDRQAGEDPPPRTAEAVRTASKGGSAAKYFQAKPSRTKQECLDLLDFIRPNRDFSMGSGGKNKKIRSPFHWARRVSPGADSIREWVNV